MKQAAFPQHLKELRHIPILVQIPADEMNERQDSDAGQTCCYQGRESLNRSGHETSGARMPEEIDWNHRQNREHHVGDGDRCCDGDRDAVGRDIRRVRPAPESRCQSSIGEDQGREKKAGEGEYMGFQNHAPGDGGTGRKQ